MVLWFYNSMSSINMHKTPLHIHTWECGNLSLQFHYLKLTFIGFLWEVHTTFNFKCRVTLEPNCKVRFGAMSRTTRWVSALILCTHLGKGSSGIWVTLTIRAGDENGSLVSPWFVLDSCMLSFVPQRFLFLTACVHVCAYTPKDSLSIAGGFVDQ